MTVHRSATLHRASEALRAGCAVVAHPRGRDVRISAWHKGMADTNASYNQISDASAERRIADWFDASSRHRRERKEIGMKSRLGIYILSATLLGLGASRALAQAHAARPGANPAIGQMAPPIYP